MDNFEQKFTDVTETSLVGLKSLYGHRGARAIQTGLPGFTYNGNKYEIVRDSAGNLWVHARGQA